MDFATKRSFLMRANSIKWDHRTVFNGGLDVIRNVIDPC